MGHSENALKYFQYWFNSKSSIELDLKRYTNGVTRAFPTNLNEEENEENLRKLGEKLQENEELIFPTQE